MMQKPHDKENNHMHGPEKVPRWRVSASCLLLIPEHKRLPQASICTWDKGHRILTMRWEEEARNQFQDGMLTEETRARLPRRIKLLTRRHPALSTSTPCFIFIVKSRLLASSAHYEWQIWAPWERGIAQGFIDLLRSNIFSMQSPYRWDRRQLRAKNHRSYI